jgi:hypothetical protein
MSYPGVKLQGMCMMCNGATFDEVLFELHGLIDRFGWAVLPVEHQLSSSWAYTIGLVEVNHPELTVFGMDAERAGGLLNHLAVLIQEGRKFLDREEITVGTERFRLASVPFHHIQSEWFAFWVNYYGALGPPYPEPRFLEVVPHGRLRTLSDD